MSELHAIPPTTSQTDRLANTLGLPCVARRLFWIDRVDDVAPARAWAADAGLPLMPLGEGSNVVLPDALDAAVLKVADKSMVVLADHNDAVTLRVGAGKPWHEFVAETLELGIYGLENLALIPGLVGAAPVQNIGAYGRECEEFVIAVHGVDLMDGAPRSLSADECDFTYRDSIFKGSLRDRFLISAVDFCLTRKPAVNIDYPVLRDRLAGQAVTPRSVFDAVVDLRRARLPDPLQTPNAGSFFKNPLLTKAQLRQVQECEPGIPVYPAANGLCKVSAAWLIEKAGLRGFELGKAGISPQHALVLVGSAGARQQDILELASHVQNRVRERFNVGLEVEPRIYY